MQEEVRRRKGPWGEVIFTLILFYVAWYIVNSVWFFLFERIDYHDTPDARLQTWFYLKHNLFFPAAFVGYAVARWALFRKSTLSALRPLLSVLIGILIWQSLQVFDFTFNVIPKIQSDAEDYHRRKAGFELERGNHKEDIRDGSNLENEVRLDGRLSGPSTGSRNLE